MPASLPSPTDAPGLPSASAPPRRGRGPAALFLTAVVLGPALSLWHLHGQWVPDGAYAYGWIVPVMGVYLAKIRWDDRPAPSAPWNGVAALVVLLALLIIPARWLQEAAPERSICGWVHALSAVGISLSLIALAGGTAWVRWFSFPLAFLLTAVPWPHSIELLVTNTLMHSTAGATVEILCLIGVPAAQVGNLVHIETGVIDIDEACSGIRSLQAMVMLSLFLGELFRLVPPRRLGLMALGIALTLVANVIRTVVLSSIAVAHGMSAVDRSHDGAGVAVLIFSLSTTLCAAYLLRPKKAPAPTPPIPSPSALPFPLPFHLSAALVLWFVVAEIAVEAWYRVREPKWQGWSWSIQWPTQSKAFSLIDIPQRSLRLLSCDDAHGAAWLEPADGSDWSAYWIRWNPGNPQAESAKVHRPDVCLNSQGATMDRDLGTRLSTVGGLQIPFHGYTFRVGETVLYVFYCLYEEMPGAKSPATANPQFEATDMFQRAWEGRRHIGQQSLEIAVTGFRSEQAAREAFEAHLKTMMQVRPGAVSQ
ncbi:MAG: exosortase/archaeosortase family protein [Chthoniobacter sp.]|uniref:exosortase/archaeosortase family protein n=1 Tax=Chthoniobacter sp. TaxID=2510640 RepID=UPI0032A4EF42